jgi:UDP-N-acetylmuramoyl-tripeptide--D-alanyl-D-alanine ligase
MKHLTPNILGAITGGEVLGHLTQEEITAVTTDSRTIQAGCLFAAMPGNRVDGHDFIAQAKGQGAACVLCNRFAPVDIPQIKVPDTQAALGAVAAFYRSQFDIPVVGITGSVGKTTAKEMIWSVLSQQLVTMKTQGNFNNELGVPLTLFQLTAAHQAAVVEMGISGFGEMTRLADMVHPTVGVFTTIGDAHLEFLGSREGVLRAKSEMIQGMPESGVVIANGDDPLLRSHDFQRRTVRFGQDGGCDVQITQVESRGLEGTDCVLRAAGRDIPVHIPALGQHMVYAAAMGAAVGLELGLSDRQIQAGIAAYAPVGSRGRVVKTAFGTVLDDCYNANPTSVRNALDNLAALPGRHVAILGDMLELGPNSLTLHQQMGDYARQTGAELLCCGALSKAMGGVWYESVEELIEALTGQIRPGDVVLVKASNAMGFGRVVRALEALSV